VIGEYCPVGACSALTPDCTSAACLKCNTDADGSEIYDTRSIRWDVDCLNTGYAKDDIGQIYKWAVLCGPCAFGCIEEENTAKGEYSCLAARQFKGNTTKATVSVNVPCQILQLAECGCAPENVFAFGFDPPKKACQSKEDCPYLCGDAPGGAAKDLCNAFSIEWWEGNNTIGSLFLDEHLTENPPIVIEIYDEQPPDS